MDKKEKEIWEKIKYLSGEIAGLTSEKSKDTHKDMYKDAMDVWYISMKYVDPELEDELDDDDDDEENDDED